MNRTYSIIVLLVIFSLPLDPGMGWGQAQPSTLSLGLRDAVLMTLEQNQSLAVERYSPEIYKTFVAEQNAAFDSVFQADTGYSETEGQRTSGVGEFRAVTSRNKTMNLGVSKQMPSGMTLGVDANLRSQDSNVFSRLYSSRLGTSLTMPLLEGRGSEVNLVGVRQAELDEELTQFELEAFTQALLAQVEELYWDLYAAREELKIQLASLELAQEQLKETKQRIDVGDMAEIELAAAEGEVALRQEAVIDAESTVETTRLELIRLLNPPHSQPWAIAVDLIESPTLGDPFPAPVDEYVAMALQSRPDLEQARMQQARWELDIVKTKNGLLPRLDFFVTFGKTGYANSFGDSVENIHQANFDLNTGFQFEYSFANRAQKARHQRAEYQVKEAEAALRNMEQLVELDVRKAYVEVNRCLRQISATQAASQLQEANYTAEIVKFRVGKSTNLLVLLVQRDLTRSRLDALRAQINLRKAWVQMDYAQGILLDKNQIVLPRNGAVGSE